MKYFLCFLLLPIILWGGSSGNTKQEDNNVIGNDIIGWSYNIFDKYASNESKKKPLFLFPKKNEMVLLENITKHDIRTISGSNSHEYFQSVSTRLGLSYDSPISVFKGSMENNFNKDSLTKKSTSFVTIQDYTWKWRVSLNIANKERDIPRLKKFLTADAGNDINKMEPKEFFEAYGTHFIALAYIGGRADYHATVENSSKWTKTDIETNIKADFGAINSSVDVNVQKTNKDISNNTKTKLTVTGGNAEFINNINNTEQYKTWASGIKDSPVLCDFDKGSLIPVWILANTPERQKQLEDYFLNTYLLQYPLPELTDSLDQRPLWTVGFQKCFYVKNKKTNTYIDLPGLGFYAKKENGTQIELSKNDLHLDRVVCFRKHTEKDLYYIYTKASHRTFEVAGDWDKNAVSNKYQKGAKIELWDFADFESQLFQFELVDKSNAGYVSVNIKSKISGMYIEPDNNNKLIQMPYTGEANQVWHFEEIDANQVLQNEITVFSFIVQNGKSGKVMDPPGKGKTKNNCKNGTNVGVFENDGGEDQVVKFVSAGEGTYFIEFQHCNGKYRLDVNGNWDKNHKDTKYKKGQNIQLYERKDSDAQKFYVRLAGWETFLIINKATGLAVTGDFSNTFQDGYPDETNQAMLWRLLESKSKETLTDIK